MEFDNSIGWTFPDEDTEHHSEDWREGPDDPIGFKFNDQDYLQVFLDPGEKDKLVDINYAEDVGYEGFLGPFNSIWPADQSGSIAGSQRGYTFITYTLDDSLEVQLIDNNEMSKDYGGETTAKKARRTKKVPIEEYGSIDIQMGLDPYAGEVWIDGDSKDELSFEYP